MTGREKNFEEETLSLTILIGERVGGGWSRYTFEIVNELLILDHTTPNEMIRFGSSCKWLSEAVEIVQHDVRSRSRDETPILWIAVEKSTQSSWALC